MVYWCSTHLYLFFCFVFKLFSFVHVQVDSLRTSHPIEVDVSKARDINEIFDAISYKKGASIINMISNFLGEETFRKGLNIYLNRFKYSNAVTEDLWQALTEGSGKDVSKAMDNWVKKMGYPVIKISETGTKGQYLVSQHRFFGCGEPSAEEDTTVWNINLGISSAASPSEIHYVYTDQKTQVVQFDKEVESETPLEWVKFNAGQSGFFRVHYEEKLFARVVLSLNSPLLPAIDRLGLLNDAFALAPSITFVPALALTSRYVDETDYVVWTSIADNLASLAVLLSGTRSRPYLTRYYLRLFSKIKSLGWDSIPGESDLTKLLRARVLSVLGGNGETAIIEESKRRFQAFLESNDTQSLPADIAGVVFSQAVQNGTEETYNQMVSLYEKLHTSTEVGPEYRLKALMAFCLARSPELVKRTLKYALSSPCLRTQDLFYPFYGTCASPEGREISWQFLQENWEEVKAKLENSNFLFGRIINQCTKDFNTESKYDEVETFFKTHKASSTERTVAQSLESIRSNIESLKMNEEVVFNWLKENYSE
eukprot:TRINITY_DN547_c0_g1_i1.p1 TRINITY_DN547_c0_g1~~TRINITY_DN547_c0_g1_i1.p1  ORF type:complete len:540 (-),score=100.11 TRINITY_DN547_c0_g1_i1:89-1708(-)